jgi:hypothetical protein
MNNLMKNIILSFLFFLLTLTNVVAQYAEPAVTGANFVPGTVDVGQTALLTISFANSGSTPIPAGSIELTISTANNYYSTNGTTAPSGVGGALFTWVYLGPDTWRGSNTAAIPAFGGGNVTLQVTGTALSPGFEVTNINVQPVSNFAAFNDSPNNNNLQPKLKVNAAAPLDTDSDGTPDVTDTDDDADGILDTQDPNPLDTDNDGTPNATDTDDDGDGILDGAEAPSQALDTDNDGTPNATDTDDDNDGIPDSSEIGILDGTGKYTLPDSDGDGLPDLADAAAPLDTDGDGTPDVTDTDDDADGILDTQDPNPLDTDNDGTPNATDTDDDGDGILDGAEAPSQALDTDNDGTPNATDTDDDNDGIPDSSEIGILDGTGKYTLPDSDGDGLPDLADAAAPLDTDGDGTPDVTDTDDDADGILDTQDPKPLDTDNDGTPNATDTDDDGDGILDGAEAPSQALDTDNDGTPNATDTDDDNDGIPDSVEQGTLIGGVYTLPDSDGDGLPDLADASGTVCVTLNLKVLLEGPYDAATDKMGTMLNQRGLLPGQTHVGPFGVDTPAGQPYTGAPWNYNGTEGSPSITYANTVVDWVLVSLRTDSLSITSTVLRKAALLHDDGHITFTDACYSLPTGNYFVVIEHRNHMGVMSGKVKVQSNTLNFDFTQQDSYVIANPPSFGQIQVNGKWMMHAADGKKDTFTDNYDINFNDSQLWKSESGFFDKYLYGDFNMDADVNFLDSVIWKKNNGRYSVVPR